MTDKGFGPPPAWDDGFDVDTLGLPVLDPAIVADDCRTLEVPAMPRVLEVPAMPRSFDVPCHSTG